MNNTGMWVQILFSFGGLFVAIGLYTLGLLNGWAYWVIGISGIVLGVVARRDIEKRRKA